MAVHSRAFILEKKLRQPQTGRPWVPCCPIRRGTDLHSFELLGTLKFSNAKSSLLVDSLAAQLMEWLTVMIMDHQSLVTVIISFSLTIIIPLSPAIDAESAAQLFIAKWTSAYFRRNNHRSWGFTGHSERSEPLFWIIAVSVPWRLTDVDVRRREHASWWRDMSLIKERFNMFDEYGAAGLYHQRSWGKTSLVNDLIMVQT